VSGSTRLSDQAPLAALREKPCPGADRKLSGKEEALPIQPVGSPARAERPAYKNSPSCT
jgi:hypothetical protein